MLYAVRPGKVSETILLRVLQNLEFDCQLDDVRQAMNYMQSAGLAETGQQDETRRWACLTTLGTAVVEFNAPAPAGIARPRRSRSSKK
jgi:hypothetical protein